MTWWKNPAVGLGKRPVKIPVWWKIFLRGRENIFLCMETLVKRHPLSRPGFPFLICFNAAKPNSNKYIISDLIDYSAASGKEALDPGNDGPGPCICS